jgi:hypothetical protein
MVDFCSLLQERDTLSTIEKKSEIELSPLPQHWISERTKFWAIVRTVGVSKVGLALPRFALNQLASLSGACGGR